MKNGCGNLGLSFINSIHVDRLIKRDGMAIVYNLWLVTAKTDVLTKMLKLQNTLYRILHVLQICSFL